MAQLGFVWEAVSSGKHYLRLSGLGIGDYELTVDRFDYTNDHGDDLSNASPIEVGQTVTGVIGLENEQDVFRFSSTVDEAYQIDLIPDGLQYPWLSLLNADGEELGSDIFATVRHNRPRRRISTLWVSASLVATDANTA